MVGGTSAERFDERLLVCQCLVVIAIVLVTTAADACMPSFGGRSNQNAVILMIRKVTVFLHSYVVFSLIVVTNF